MLKADVESIEGAGKVQKIKMRYVIVFSTMSDTIVLIHNRYGPYSVPNMMKKSVMNEGGALWNCEFGLQVLPCSIRQVN